LLELLLLIAHEDLERGTVGTQTQRSLKGRIRIAEMPILLAIPLFTFAGYVVSESQAPARLVRLTRALLGFAGLTAVAFTTRKDFTFLGGMIKWAGVMALVAIVAAVFFGFELGTWFSVAMVGLAGAAILHDTSNVLHHYPEDRYVAAALQLFASVALMFWYVLRIFMASRD